MQFEMFGQPGKPYLILLGPALCTLDVMRPMAERLASNCRVLAVTYDGHDRGDLLYKGPADQAMQVMAYLKNRKVKRVRLIAGVGAGAPTAIELDRLMRADGSIVPGHVLCDGGYFRHMAAPRRLMRWLLLRILLKKARTGTPEEAEAALLKSPLLRLYTGRDPLPYAPMVRDFVKAGRVLSRWSERRIVRTVLHCRPYDLPEEAQRAIVFLWSKGDHAAISRQNIRNVFPHSMRQTIAESGRLGFFMRRPQDYELLIRGLAQVPAP